MFLGCSSGHAYGGSNRRCWPTIGCICLSELRMVGGLLPGMSILGSKQARHLLLGDGYRNPDWEEALSCPIQYLKLIAEVTVCTSRGAAGGLSVLNLSKLSLASIK